MPVSGIVCSVDITVQDQQGHLSSCSHKTSTFFDSKQDHAHVLIMS